MDKELSKSDWLLLLSSNINALSNLLMDVKSIVDNKSNKHFNSLFLVVYMANLSLVAIVGLIQIEDFLSGILLLIMFVFLTVILLVFNRNISNKIKRDNEEYKEFVKDARRGIRGIDDIIHGIVNGELKTHKEILKVYNKLEH